MARWLTNLIIAAEARWGGSQTATAEEGLGAEVVTRILGSQGTQGMADFIVNSVTFGNIGPPAPPDSLTVYNNGDSFTITFTVSEAGLAHHIRRIDAAAILVQCLGLVGINITSRTVGSANGASGSSVTFSLVAPPRPALIGGVTTFIWFEGYTSPNEPPGGSSANVRVTPSIGQGSAGTVDDTVQIQYVLDWAGYNDSTDVPSSIVQYPFRINKRNLLTSDYAWVWEYSLNGGGSWLNGGTGTFMVFGSWPGQFTDIRYKYTPPGQSQSDWVYTSFQDNRPGS